MLTVNVTGHRQIVPAGHMGPRWPDQSEEVKDHHQKVMWRVAEILGYWQEHNGLETCISGMALGADTLFAKAVIRMKRMGWPVKLIAAVPFAGQESRWNAGAKAEFHRILQEADQTVTVSEGSYAPWKMQVRNEWMVNHSDFVLAIWEGTQKGGTWNCIKYATSKGKQVWHLDPQTLECKLMEG